MITLKTDQRPYKVVDLECSTVSFYEHFVWTQFGDGSGFGGVVPDEKGWHYPDYVELALDLGYPDAISYCREHDFLHNALSEWVPIHVTGIPFRHSPIMWCLAHEIEDPPTTVYEEALVIAFQGFLRGGKKMPATSPRVDWWLIRERVRRLLGG